MKKINPVFLFIGGFIVVSLIAIAIMANNEDAPETALDSLEKDSVGLALASENKDGKINTYQREFNEKKNPKEVEQITPNFQIEESNLAEKKSVEKEKEPVKEDKQVGGSYNSPYGSNNSGSNNATQRKTTPKTETPKEEEEEESVFNSSSPAASKKNYKAVIHGDQKVRQGSTVTLRLQEDATVSGKKVPRNTIISGTLVGASGGRLTITIGNFQAVVAEGVVLDNDYQAGVRYDQESESAVATEGKSIGKEMIGDALRKLPGGRYAERLARSARGKDGTIYLIDGYKIFIQTK